MAFDDATLTVAANAIASRITHVSIHTTGTLADSTGESTAARQPVTWSVDADGDLTAGPISFTGGAASGPATRVGYWTAASGGTYCGGVFLNGDTSFNSAGEYTVNSITETGTSS